MIGSLVLFLARPCAAKSEKTTKENNIGRPNPADKGYPFRKKLVPGFPYLDAKDYQDKLPLESAPSDCQTKVDQFNVYTTGTLKGGLKYHQGARGGSSLPALNGSTDLGGVYEKQAVGATYFFKYQVEISWIGDMKDAFSGQMMVTAPVKLDSKEKEIEFHDDGPDNDWIDKEWDVPSDWKGTFEEYKKQFPITETDGNTVRWIDAPGGHSIRMSDMKNYALFYAGACKKVTNVKVFKIEYPSGKNPTMTEVSPPESLKDEVKGFKYKRED
jgi:hypothetical protein